MHEIQIKHRQEGATLIVVMILILVSSLLGISSFEDSGINQQLAHNSRHSEEAFRAAEGAVNRIVSPASISTLMNSTSDELTNSTGVISNSASDSVLRHNGAGLSRGFSLGEGIAGLVPYQFSATTTVTLNGVNARSTVIRGAEHYGPKL